METWHEKDCRRPDVVVVDTMLSCMSCGSLFNRDDKGVSADRGELWKGISEAEDTLAQLDLSWPSTVEFSNPDDIQDSSVRETVKQLQNMLEKQRGNLEDDRDKSPVGASAASYATCTNDKRVSECETEKNSISTATKQDKGNHFDSLRRQETSLVYDCITGADEIRLLHLSPKKSADDQILHGVLESTRLRLRPDFTAVSYTWADSHGDRSLGEEIFLGDMWIPLPITSNCAAALRRLRSGNEIRIFWVDSICIDQASTDEKSHQVGLMRDIFSRATSVAIFLGGDEDTPEARLFKRTGESLFYNGNQGEITWDAVRDHLAVRALFDRPYWSRVWVIQEVLLSKKAIVVLGQTAIPLQSLLKASLLEPNGSKRELGLPAWLKLGRTLPIRDFHGLSILLTETSKCLATDPKDMVFALLGLVQGAHLEGLVADYSKSIQEIRFGIAAYFLIRHGQIRILKSAAFEAGTRQDGHLRPLSPTWVPSWEPHPQSESNFADSVDAQCWTDLKRGSLCGDSDRTMRCYDTLRPIESGIGASLSCSQIKASSFRVLKGTGALLAEAYPLLCIGSPLIRGAFKYRSANRSALLTPSASTVRWAIYAIRQCLDKSLNFGLPGDWIVEIPGCDDFFLLREIPSLPGAYRIASVCGLAIAADWANTWLPDGELAPPEIGSVLPRYINDELVSRLVVFDQQELQFLQTWEMLAPPGTALGPLSKEPGTSVVESRVSLSEEEILRYKQWADYVRETPLRATQPTSFGETLENVSAYLDRWQDPELWGRIISELGPFPWSNLLETMAEVRSGLCCDCPPDGRVAGSSREQSLRACQTLRTMIMNLRGFLHHLALPGPPLAPSAVVDVLELRLQALDEANTTNFLEVFMANQDEIQKYLEQLRSYLEFIRDALPKCLTIRDKFAQRQLLNQLYKRSELRQFLIY
jgi:hypothetical protein